MRKVFPEKLENGRYRSGDIASPTGSTYGVFQIEGPMRVPLRIVSSGGNHPDDNVSEGWEHVSVSTPSRMPNWIEMCFVKDLFWEDEECVVQYHPPKSQYVNNHPYCLHLFRPSDGNVRMPPSILVGIKSLGDLSKKP